MEPKQPTLKERSILAILENNLVFSIPEGSHRDIDIEKYAYEYGYSNTPGRRFEIAMKNHHFTIARYYIKYIPNYLKETHFTLTMCFAIENKDEYVKRHHREIFDDWYNEYQVSVACIRAGDIAELLLHINEIDEEENISYLVTELIYKQDIPLTKVCKNLIDEQAIVPYSTSLAQMYPQLGNVKYIFACIDEGIITVDDMLKSSLQTSKILGNRELDGLIISIRNEYYPNIPIKTFFDNGFMGKTTGRHEILLMINNLDLDNYNDVVKVRKDMWISKIKDEVLEDIEDLKLSKYLVDDGVMTRSLLMLFAPVYRDRYLERLTDRYTIMNMELNSSVNILKELIADYLIIYPHTL